MIPVTMLFSNEYEAERVQKLILQERDASRYSHGTFERAALTDMARIIGAAVERSRKCLPPLIGGGR